MPVEVEVAEVEVAAGAAPSRRARVFFFFLEAPKQRGKPPGPTRPPLPTHSEHRAVGPVGQRVAECVDVWTRGRVGARGLARPAMRLFAAPTNLFLGRVSAAPASTPLFRPSNTQVKQGM